MLFFSTYFHKSETFYDSLFVNRFAVQLVFCGAQCTVLRSAICPKFLPSNIHILLQFISLAMSYESKAIPLLS